MLTNVVWDVARATAILIMWVRDVHRGVESLEVHQKVSTFNAEGPPVPIPNTEVKLCSAENTWLATAREDRSALTQ